MSSAKSASVKNALTEVDKESTDNNVRIPRYNKTRVI